MRQLPTYILLAVMLAFLAVAGWQGQQLVKLREAEGFYRWMIAAANQVVVFDGLEHVMEDLENPNRPEPVDEEFFAQVESATEEFLPADIPIQEEDLDEEGEPRSALVRAVRQGGYQEELWRLANSSELAHLRRDFNQYVNERRLASIGEQFDLEEMYAQGTLVNLGNMFLGFRKMMANLIWLEVDRYWHEGQYHRMVPLMRTTVALDPSFVEAFILGAWHLAYNITAPMPPTPDALKEYSEEYDDWIGQRERFYYEAVDFLKDGIRKNPTDFRLYFDLGFAVYHEKLEDNENAVRYLREAIRYPHETWARRTYYRMLEENGQYEEALEGWRQYREEFPDNQVAPLFVERNRGLLYEQRAEEAYAEADEAEAEGRTEEAEELRAYADEQYANARETWQRLIAMSGGSHPFAETRLQRMDALELANEGRYYEAVALLEYARWESSEFFDEASELIIEIKQEGDLPLTLSEIQYLERQREAEQRRQMQEEMNTD
ncbi:MAG: hypothetical protein R6W89_04555 [Candidatus Hydrogenedentota bacterium]